MSKIVSKRGRKEVPIPAPTHISGEVQIYIYSGTGQAQPLTKEEMEEIGRVFESIRKQLDLVIHCSQDWMI